MSRTNKHLIQANHQSGRELAEDGVVTAAKVTGATAVAIRVGKDAVLTGAGREAAKAVLTNAAGKTTANLVLKGGTRAAAPIAVVAGVVEFGIKQSHTTKEFEAGRISRREYNAQTGENAGGAVGGLGGAAAGALVGSAIFPGVGTLVGAMVGSLCGSSAGSAGGRAIGESWW